LTNHVTETEVLMINFASGGAASGDTTANGYLALPEQENAPAVLVLHAWWGLTDFFKSLCDQLAAEGYVVLAADLYGDGRTTDDIATAEQFIQRESESYQNILATVQGAVNQLRSHPAANGKPIGVVSFSMGAAYALLAATEVSPNDIAAVVLFYGNHTGLDAANFAKSSAAFLGHFAEDDPYESVEDMRNTQAEMEKAGREASFYVYEGAGHWFFESNRPDAYAAEAAQLAWERTIGFLREHLLRK
jgi:carboxymethylenebutenolidase